MMKKFLMIWFVLIGTIAVSQTNNPGLTCMLMPACGGTMVDQIVDGDFNGLTLPAPATTDITNNALQCTGDNYMIATSTDQLCVVSGFWPVLFDFNLQGTSGLMVIDSPQLNDVIYRHPVNLTAGLPHVFEISILPDVSNFNVGGNLTLTVQLNDNAGNIIPVAVFNNTNYTQGNFNWNNICQIVTPTMSGAFDLEIIPTGLNASGDFAIDNIHFRSCCDDPTGNIVGPTDICLGDAATLNFFTSDLNHTSYSWSPGGGTGASITVSPTTTTTYTLTVTNECGSVENFTYTVNVIDPNPTIQNTPQIFCIGDPALTLSAIPNGPGTGVWSGPGVSGNSFDPAAAGVGTHTVTYTYTENGCVGTDQVVFTVNPGPVITTTLNIGPFCESAGPVTIGFQVFGNQITGNFNPGGFGAGGNFTPAPGIVFPTGILGPIEFDPSQANIGNNPITWNVTQNGCTSSLTVNVVVNANPTPNIVGPPAFCAGDVVNLTSVPNNVTSNYSWTGPNIVSATNINPIMIDGGGSYTVTEMDANGCVGTDNILIFPSPTPNVTVTSSTVNCVTTLTANATGGGPTFCAWTDPNGNFAGFGTSITATISGLYCVTCTSLIGAGCSDTECINVFVPGNPTYLGTLPDSMCVTDPPIDIGNYGIFNIWQTTPHFAPGFSFLGGFTLTPQVQLQGSIFGGDVIFDHGGFIGSFPVTWNTNFGGCPGQVTHTIDVYDISFANIDPIADVSNCDDPFTINTWCSDPVGPPNEPVGSNTEIYMTPDPGLPAWDPITQVFDPAFAPVGQYCVTFICNNGPCSDTTELCFNVTDGYWHQTTELSSGAEVINDVITDSQGNVYVVGTANGPTELNGGCQPNIPIVPTGVSSVSFVAKYDPCGCLLWAAHSDGSLNPETGVGITVDEANDLVYITGDYFDFITYHNAVNNIGAPTCPGPSITLTGGPQKGYVAQFDGTTGCLYFVEQISENNFTNSRDITINETTGDIFVGGMYAPNFAGINGTAANGLFVHKYTPTTTLGIGNTINPVIWTSTGNLLASRVNDMEYDEQNQRLWFTGEHNQELFLSTGHFTTTTFNVQREAYFVALNDAGATATTIPASFRSLNSPQGFGSVGEGVGIDPLTGNPYFTGTYFHTGTADPFFLVSGTFTSDVLTGANNDGKAYFIGVDIGSASAWVRQAETVAGGDVSGTAVDFVNDHAYFVGDFESSDVAITGLATQPYLTIPAGIPHVYTARYDASGGGACANATQSPAGSSHSSRSIGIDNQGHTFVVGEYRGTMDYIFGNPNSGPLVSNPGGATNGFIMRTQQLTCEYRTQENVVEYEETEVEVLMEQPAVQISAYPNPTNGTFTIAIDGYAFSTPATIVIYNAQGQQVLATTSNDRTIDLDLSKEERGLYLVKVQVGDKVQTIRLSKM